MTAIAPGVWSDDDGTLHVDVDAVLIANGYEPNEQTRRMLEACWRDMARQLGAELVVER